MQAPEIPFCWGSLRVSRDTRRESLWHHNLSRHVRCFKREEAATFTFLLSAPIIAAAGSKQLIDVARGGDNSGTDASLYFVGLVTAAIVGYAAIAFLIRHLRFNSLDVFVVYRVALGLLVLLLVAAGVM